MAMDPSNHDTLRELASLYVLGRLTAEERLAFTGHLATCAECAADVKSLAAVATALAQAPPQLDPPAALRDRVLASASSPRVVSESAPSGPRVSSESTPSRVSINWLPLAASLALAIGLAGYAVQLRGRISTLEARLQDALARADASERQIADARRASLEAQSQVAVLTAPDVTRVDFVGQQTAPSAQARAFWSRSRGLVLTAANLPPLPPGRTYQLWFVSGNKPVSAGIFDPDSTGGANVLLTTPPDVPRPDVLAVTIEPAGGVPAPTGAMYLLGNVQAL